MDDTGLQPNSNQLPPNLETPINPPPVQPPTPPLPPAPVPPTTPAPEQPATKKPAGRFKKNAKKIVVGTLMFMLLAGGAYFGVSEVQKRQTAEQQATGRVVEEGKAVPQLTEAEYQDKLKNYKTVVEGCILEEDSPGHSILGRIPNCGGGGETQGCPAGTTLVCDPNAPKYCRGKYAAKWYQRDVGCCSEPVEECERNSWGKRSCSTTCFDPRTYDCVCQTPGSSPSPSPSVTPSPSPSPESSFACVDLTKNKTAPTIGDTVTFTCEATFSGIDPVAFFRYSSDNGTTFSNPLPEGGLAVNPATNNASYDITINKTGDWEVQCRLCSDLTTTATCTAWGKAN